MYLIIQCYLFNNNIKYLICSKYVIISVKQQRNLANIREGWLMITVTKKVNKNCMSFSCMKAEHSASSLPLPLFYFFTQ